jgi:hypothetical protein
MGADCINVRMITGGEDALYIARRLVVVASEDVGLADNHALPLVSLLEVSERTRLDCSLLSPFCFLEHASKP